MRHTLHLLLVAILLLSLKSARAQIFNEQERLRIACGFGLTNHLNNPVLFDGYWIDNLEVPNSQCPELGHQWSASYLIRINDHIFFGPSYVSSHFGFYEEGKRYGSWLPPSGIDYSTTRSFKMTGIGVDVLYSLFSNKVNGIDLIGGVTREWFRETPGVYPFIDMYRKSNYFGHLKIEYKHLILENLNLNIGFFGSMSLGSFYEHIDYRPYRAGIAVGVEYVFVRKISE
ncbi:MAG TPA: hypothetical protein VJ917_05455 [Saprospiraceae bacterium]|nr:hypothetical protein [Saprospiraceae bacterium]